MARGENRPTERRLQPDMADQNRRKGVTDGPPAKVRSSARNGHPSLRS